MEVQLGPEDFARYPFLPEAGEHVRRLALNLTDLIHPDYEPVLERAKQRVAEDLEQKPVRSGMTVTEREVISFPLALLLIKATGMDHLARRFSLSEARRVEGFLGAERPETVAFLFKKLFGADVGLVPRSSPMRDRFEFILPVQEYLARSVGFHKPEWKLVNRPVERGLVYLARTNLIRLIREEVVDLILERIRNLSLPKLPEKFLPITEELVRSYPPPPASGQELEGLPSKYPPCASKALEMLAKGENVPHYGRFLMTSYLLSVGKTVDDVIQLFPRAPDFSEKVTRYQVEHIAGLRGGRTKYNVPSCRTLQAHSFCFKTDECEGITNPVQFGRKSRAVVKGARKRRQGSS